MLVSFLGYPSFYLFMLYLFGIGLHLIGLLGPRDPRFICLPRQSTHIWLQSDSSLANMPPLALYKQCGDVVWCFMVWCHHM